MNWLTRIRDILGSFWIDIFGDGDFITGLENLHALFGQLHKAQLDHGIAGRSCIRPQSRFGCAMPFSMYIDKSSVQPAAYSYSDVLNYDNTLGKDKPDGGYVCRPTYRIPEPWQITDHVIDYTRTLVSGFDYDFVDGTIILHVDPATLKLPTVNMLDEHGVLKTYYRLFGWCRPALAVNDSVAALESTLLSDAPTAAIAWDMHQNGASVKNVKKLLGAVTDSVVSDNAGVITDYWIEQDRHYVLVSGKAYGAPSSVPLGRNTRTSTARQWTKGDSVADGDILFGSLKVYSMDTDPSASEVPSVRIRTDVGEMIAQNSTLDSIAAVLPDSRIIRVLPLSAPEGGSTAAYVDKCKELAMDIDCPRISVPNKVNPFLFVTRKLRRGRNAFASVTVTESTVNRVMAALACIRKCMCASSILNTYVQASSGPVRAGIIAGFTATAGNAAVSEDATVIVKSMLAEAKGGI